ncbi:alpha/beta fold hydrolase [Natroniella sp. ANB-PHB2]|uniref:intracellular short-chain-length polyhydroxyalkanoate depolymerase n=1 Tax=Natroniella sp. ANB-PHB2 TaxID=3384444 RepID=UPI0038D49DBD
MNIELKSVKLSNGETMAYREREGGSQLLILVHGNMSSSKHWDIFMEEIDEKYKVYAVDLRGFGDSTYHQQINSLADFANDLKLFTDELNLRNFHLMGWSTGGGVIMEFAASYPDDVEKLVLLEAVSTRGYPIFKKNEKGEPIPGELLSTREEIAKDPVQVVPILKTYKNQDKERLKIIWNNLIYTDNKPAPEKYDEYLEATLKQRNLVDVDYALANFNISSEYNGVKEGNGRAEKIIAPTLVLWGTNDQVVPEQMALDIVNDIGDNTHLVYLDDCGHSPLTDDLEQVITVVTDFITS